MTEVDELEAENANLRGCLWNLAADPDYVLSMSIVIDSQTEIITKLEGRLKAVHDCQTYIVELDDCEQEWFKKADVLKAIGGKCEHGRGLTDFCEPCGRVNGGDEVQAMLNAVNVMESQSVLITKLQQELAESNDAMSQAQWRFEQAEAQLDAVRGLPEKWRKKDMRNPFEPLIGAGASIAFTAAADQLQEALQEGK